MKENKKTKNKKQDPTTRRRGSPADCISSENRRDDEDMGDRFSFSIEVRAQPVRKKKRSAIEFSIYCLQQQEDFHLPKNQTPPSTVTFPLLLQICTVFIIGNENLCDGFLEKKSFRV